MDLYSSPPPPPPPPPPPTTGHHRYRAYVCQGSIQWGAGGEEASPPPPPPPKRFCVNDFFFLIPQRNDTFSLEATTKVKCVFSYEMGLLYSSPCTLCKIFTLGVGLKASPPKEIFQIEPCMYVCGVALFLSGLGHEEVLIFDVCTFHF